MATRLETRPRQAGTALETGMIPREWAGMEASQALTRRSVKAALLRLGSSVALVYFALARIDLQGINQILHGEPQR